MKATLRAFVVLATTLLISPVAINVAVAAELEVML